MNRAEAMDLIQRQLDGDLTQEEHIALEEQLRVDSELQLFRQRLQRVSAELHSLPRVMPPFSLVDAILPKLADEAPASLLLPAQGSESEQQLAATETLWLDTRQNEQQLTSKKRLPVWLGKSAIGAVAACLLIGMFSAFGAWKQNDQPGQVPEAGLPGKEQPFVVAPKSEEQQEKKSDEKKTPDKKTEQKNEQKQEQKNEQQQTTKTEKQTESKKQDSKGSQSRPPAAVQKKEKPQQNQASDKSREERSKEFLNDLKEYVKTHKGNGGKGDIDWEKLDELIKKSIEENRQKYDRDPQGWRDLEKKLKGNKPDRSDEAKKEGNKH